MPDFETSLNQDPEDALRSPGAIALGDPPITISGALADYASRPQASGNSPGILMDDQQMRDAGVHPDQSGAAPDVSAIDATGASDSSADPAGGCAKVARWTKGAVKIAHTAASELAKAAGATASDPMITGLKTLNTVYSVPLSAAEGVARGATDLRNGASLPDAIVGNVMRTGLVAGAGMIPYVGPGAAFAANRYLPDGAAMGHAYHQSFVDTDGRALLLP